MDDNSDRNLELNAASGAEPGLPIPPQAPPGASVLDELPEATLADLPEKLQAGVRLAGWNELMPVQSKAIPYLFARRDMMIQSRTGSGKTAAYLLPILEMVNPHQKDTQALVLVPTPRAGAPGSRRGGGPG